MEIPDQQILIYDQDENFQDANVNIDDEADDDESSVVADEVETKEKGRFVRNSLVMKTKEKIGIISNKFE